MGHGLYSEFYKHVLGRLLALGTKMNYFGYPPNLWPPPTPARKYIEDFLNIYSEFIHGRCLEFSPPVYRDRYGSSAKVSHYDVWDVADSPETTIVGDLQHCPHVADNTFDTIICTHVLCNIPRPWLAVDEMYRILKPGGLVLCTAPVVLQKYAPHPQDCWRFTKDSLSLLFERFSQTNQHSYGNAVTVAASPQYLMVEHLPAKILNWHDEECPSIVAIAAWK